MRRRRLRKVRGFTTIELLVTLAILALLTTGVVAGLGIGRQSWRASREKETRAELEAGLRAVRDLLGRAAPIVQMRPGSSPITLFDGGADAVEFVALNEPGAQWGGFLRVRVSVDPAVGKLAMTSAVFRPASSQTGGAGAQTADVVGGVTEFQLRYYGRTGDEAAGRWFDEWRGIERLPELVAIRISRSLRGRTETAEDVVALRQN